jgi:hypothetical protein
MVDEAGGAAMGAGMFLLWLCFSLAPALAWFTHIYVCFTDGRWVFLLVGAGVFPIGVLNGFGVWFGFW